MEGVEQLRQCSGPPDRSAPATPRLLGGYRAHMNAAVHTRYGPPNVVRVVDVPTPTAKVNEVLVKVHATTVNRTDCASGGLSRSSSGSSPGWCGHG